jgi:Zn-dependent membrane protease YugP
MILYWVIFGALMILSWIISSQLKARFRKYSEIPVGLSGREVALKMLRDNGIFDIEVTCVEGELTDHYNPEKRTVNLSQPVYEGQNIAAAAVAAHECGHAVQHAKAYAWLQMRSALVPVVSFSSQWIQWILLGGILLIHTFPQLLLAGIVLFALTTIFSIITLPVEVDASRRALVWLNTSGLSNNDTYEKASDALKLAAYTYFIAALTSLATLLYYIMLFMGARNR